MEIKRSIYKLFITDYYQPATIIKSEFAQWSFAKNFFLEKKPTNERLKRIHGKCRLHFILIEKSLLEPSVGEERQKKAATSS
jgi:hypothetical protein